MVTRKQFIFRALRNVIRFAEVISPCSSPSPATESPKPDTVDIESVFQKALALGIDPGTKDFDQLTQLVQQAALADTKTYR
ncbi:hypothetical protein [uncultured Desulfosarcina sp.]|uniref:hypothetical protein n=1 Tax=uncultured Desulfosarcina sp. TaxID=218289 RepID=UPI0029C66697|nr:hypothetical protein [uncultured Desulfosarcina sp.]